MAQRNLRAVAPDEKPPAKRRTRVKTVMQAVAGGDHREQLIALRSRIATAVDDPNIRGADLAALSRRLLEVSKEIDALDARAAEEAKEGDITPDDAWEAV